MSVTLLGDAAVSNLDKEIDGFLLKTGSNPGSTQVSDFLRLYSAGERRDEAARALIARGVSPEAVGNALTFLDAASRWDLKKVGGVLTVLSAAASGFHGYRRNHSILWGLAWFVLGGIFPIVTPVIAVAQGFGKRKAA